MIRVAAAASKPLLKGTVRIDNLLAGIHDKDDDDDDVQQPKKSTVPRLDMTELCTTVHRKTGLRSPVRSSFENSSDGDGDDDEPPPPF